MGARCSAEDGRCHDVASGCESFAWERGRAHAFVARGVIVCRYAPIPPNDDAARNEGMSPASLPREAFTPACDVMAPPIFRAAACAHARRGPNPVPEVR